MTWDGKDRRILSDERLHNIELQVTRLVAHTESESGNLALMIANIIKDQANYKEEFKDHRKDFKEHLQSDQTNFDNIKEYIAKARGMLIVTVSVVGAISTLIISWITSIKH